MMTLWTPTSMSLPGEGHLVEFLLEDRDSPLWGVYQLGQFESRWSCYLPPKVCQWRDLVSHLGLEPSLASMIRRQRHRLAMTDRLEVAA